MPPAPAEIAEAALEALAGPDGGLYATCSEFKTAVPLLFPVQVMENDVDDRP